jgi:hypothetical protein
MVGLFSGTLQASIIENPGILRLQKIDEVRVVKEYETISWTIDLNDVEYRRKVIETQIEQVKNSVCNSEDCIENMETLKEDLLESKFLLDQNPKEFQKERKIRKQEDEFVKIAENLDDYHSQVVYNPEQLDLLQSSTENKDDLSEELPDYDMIEEQSHDELVKNIQKAVNDFSEEMRKIIMTKKFPGFSGNFDEIKEKLRDQFESISVPDGYQVGLTLDEALRLKFDTTTSENEIKFSLKVPIVAQKPSELFKIIPIPVRIENLVVLLIQNANYVVLDGEDSVTFFNNLGGCFETSNKSLLCENDPEDFPKDECLRGIPLDIKSEWCFDSIFAAKLPKTVQIEFDNDKVWYWQNTTQKGLFCDFEDEILVQDSCSSIFFESSENYFMMYLSINDEFFKQLTEVSLPILDSNRTYDLDEFYMETARFSEFSTHNSPVKKILRNDNIIKCLGIYFKISTITLVSWIFFVVVFVIAYFKIRSLKKSNAPVSINTPRRVRVKQRNNIVYSSLTY